nr:MGMT family protein [Candidatus Frankia alpina]
MAASRAAVHRGRPADRRVLRRRAARLHPDPAHPGDRVPGGVWEALESIPYGTTVSYGQLAGRIGADRRDVRAVGTAVGANPLLLVRPCHRVIGADGALRGFAAGLLRKEFLLRDEGALALTLDLATAPTATGGSRG